MKKQTTTKSQAKKGMSTGKKMAVAGAVTAGIAAVGAGAYMLMGSDGKKNQKKIKALMGKIEKEVKSEFKKAKVATGPVYDAAVDKIAETYSKQYKAYEGDIKAVAKAMKSQWRVASKAAIKKVPKVKVTIKTSKNK